MSRYAKLFLQMFVVTILYLVLDYFDLVTWYLILGILLLVAVYIYFQIRVTDNELYMELVCNTNLYLRRLEKSADAKADSDVYHLGLAYAAMYQGNVETMEQELNRVDETRLPNPSRQVPIYIRIRANLAYHQNDLDTLSRLLDEAKEKELELIIGYVMVLKLYLNEQYDELVLLMKDLIPKERTRLHMIELEYYLALTYMQLGRTEDALAVLEFIVKKGYGIIHTDWAYDTYIEIKESE